MKADEEQQLMWKKPPSLMDHETHPNDHTPGAAGPKTPADRSRGSKRAPRATRRPSEASTRPQRPHLAMVCARERCTSPQSGAHGCQTHASARASLCSNGLFPGGRRRSHAGPHEPWQMPSRLRASPQQAEPRRHVRGTRCLRMRLFCMCGIALLSDCASHPAHASGAFCETSCAQECHKASATRSANILDALGSALLVPECMDYAEGPAIARPHSSGCLRPGSGGRWGGGGGEMSKLVGSAALESLQPQMWYESSVTI